MQAEGINNICVAQLHTNREWGGGENQILSLVRGLVGRGVRCVLLTPRDGVLWERARAVGIWTEPLESHSGARSGVRQHALDVVKELGASVLHAHDSGSVSHGGWLSARTGVPLVLSRRVASPLRRNPLSRLKYGSARVAGVLAISETVKSVFCESGYPPERVWVVPSGLDFASLDRVQPDADKRAQFGKAPLVGGIGKLSEKKNWRLMVEAAHALNARGVHIEWALLGSGPEEDALRALVAERKLGEHFKFLGFQEDAASWLKTFDLLFFPSRIEGASVTVREAMALGVPVVAANAAGTMESLDGCGWIIDPDDVDSAADTVYGVLNDSAERDKRVAAAREIARSRYAQEQTIEGTLAAYRRVLA